MKDDKYPKSDSDPIRLAQASARPAERRQELRSGRPPVPSARYRCRGRRGRGSARRSGIAKAVDPPPRIPTGSRTSAAGRVDPGASYPSTRLPTATAGVLLKYRKFDEVEHDIERGWDKAKAGSSLA